MHWMKAMYDAGLASDAVLQRCRGVARLRFERRGPVTRVIERYAASPARLLAPRPGAAAPEVVLANTSGGVAGGDRFEIAVSVGPGADATVTGQAAEKIYRALDLPAQMATQLDVAADATLEWLPQETILFDGAQLQRQISVTLAEDARLLMAETVVLGRQAHGEAFRDGKLQDRWRIDRAGAPVWRDAIQVAGGAPSLEAPSGFAGARALATIVYAAPDAAAHLETLRALLPSASPFAGATHVRGLLVARLLGDEAGALKQGISDIIGTFRGAVLDRPSRAPRVWLC